MGYWGDTEKIKERKKENGRSIFSEKNFFG